MIGLLRYSSLHNAASKGDLETIKFVKQKFGLNLDQKSAYGFTPLHFAATNGKMGVVRYLIENGANINAKSYSQWTPFHLAARYGHLQIVEYLVEQGCEVDVTKVEIDCPNFLPKVKDYLGSNAKTRRPSDSSTDSDGIKLTKDLWPYLDVYAKKYKDPKVDEYLKSITF